MSELTSSHAILSSLTAWFSENIPYGGPGCYLDHHAEIKKRPLEAILQDLCAERSSVLCGGAALFMKLRAEELGYVAFTMNFGNPMGPESHVIVVSRLALGSYGFYDPTLGVFIADCHGQPANITDIVQALRTRNKHTLRFSPVGSRTKKVLLNSNYVETLKTICPHAKFSKMDDAIIAEICVDNLASHSFGAIDSWLKSKIENPISFDFLRFPIGTSGEAEAEELAQQLAHIG